MHLTVGILQPGDGAHHFFELHRDTVQVADHAFEVSRRAVYHFAGERSVAADTLGFLARLLDLMDHALGSLRDHAGGFFHALGELAHFVGDHREAAPDLACARRLDRGVQSQKIGLIGNVVDQLPDVANAGRVLGELAHRFVDPAQACLDALHALGDFQQLLIRAACDPQIALGEAGHLHSARGHRVHRQRHRIAAPEDGVGQLTLPCGAAGRIVDQAGHAGLCRSQLRSKAAARCRPARAPCSGSD